MMSLKMPPSHAVCGPCRINTLYHQHTTKTKTDLVLSRNPNVPLEQVLCTVRQLGRVRIEALYQRHTQSLSNGTAVMEGDVQRDGLCATVCALRRAACDRSPTLRSLGVRDGRTMRVKAKERVSGGCRESRAIWFHGNLSHTCAKLYTTCVIAYVRIGNR